MGLDFDLRMQTDGLLPTGPCRCHRRFTV